MYEDALLECLTARAEGGFHDEYPFAFRHAVHEELQRRRLVPAYMLLLYPQRTVGQLEAAPVPADGGGIQGAHGAAKLYRLAGHADHHIKGN